MSEIAQAKALAQRYWAACDAGDTAELSRILAPGVTWEGPWPVKLARSGAEVAEIWTSPLARAIPDLQRQFHILTAGVSNAHADGSADGRLWAAGTGYLSGTAVSDVFGIPATGQPLRLRWGEFLCIEGGRIVEVQLILDFVDWFEQIGRPVLRPLGVPGVWPAATAFDAVLNEDQDPRETAQTLQFGRDFIYAGLNGFDQDGLSSMGMADYFHPNLKWYGPGGIGGCLSLREFEDRHQSVWLDAFPDRKVQNLRALFAEGRVLSGSGTSGVIATHTGPYLGTQASGARLDISGIDFWLRTDQQLTENWVFVDMIKLFTQMGVDLFERMKEWP